jgi:hypothetical protein
MNLFAGRNMKFYATTEAKIAKLTRDEVNEAIRKYFDPETLVIVTAGDFARNTKVSTEKPSAPPVVDPADKSDDKPDSKPNADPAPPAAQKPAVTKEPSAAK